MENKTKKRRCIALVVAMMTTAVPTLSAPVLKGLDIRVVLRHDGSAVITETRRMTIDGEGTECFIGLANLGGSRVSGLWVADETGRRYERLSEWDTGLSRSQKTGKCGIVKTGKGYELCWGLGSEGERTYTTGYVMTGLALHLMADKEHQDFKDRVAEMRQVFGLRKFLCEFTLLDERHAKEVTLWKDYMVWATLFGISQQVMADMRKINPDYFSLDTLAAQMANASTLPAIFKAADYGISHYERPKSTMRDRYERAHGGGGGFSGGGGGGGVR